MQTFNLGELTSTSGARVETTNVGYTAWTQPDSAISRTALVACARDELVHQLLPKLQLRYAVDDNTNLRLAVTRGIARPDYLELAPFF